MTATTLGSKIDARAMWDPTASAFAKYVRSCRNAEKRAYAEHYAGHALGMSPEPDPLAYALSYMGAQAVRLAIAAIKRDGTC